jgi:hypothetical protein
MRGGLRAEWPRGHRLQRVRGVELPFPEALDEEPPYGRHLRGAARGEHRVDVAVREPRPLKRVVGGLPHAGEVGGDQSLELGAGDVGGQPDAVAVEVEPRRLGLGQADLHGADRLVELEAEVEVDEVDQPLHGVGIVAGGLELAQLRHRVRRLQPGQLVPLAEGRVDVGRDGQQLAEGAVVRAAAELRRHVMADQAVVEGVASEADAAVGQRLRVAAPAGPVEPDHGKVGGAAAEVGHEHGLVAVEVAGVPVGGAERLVGEVDRAESGLGEGRAEPPHREGLVGVLAGEDDRAPRHDAARAGEQSVALGREVAEEGRHEVLDREAPAEEPRLGEGAAAEVGLDGLDEAPAFPPRQRVLQRLGSARGVEHGAGRTALAPEGQRGAEHADVARRRGPGQAPHRAVLLHDRDRAVGRAEIDADGAHGSKSRDTKRPPGRGARRRGPG